MNNIPGINQLNIRRWMDEKVSGIEGELTFEKILGGRSNLTFTLKDSSTRKWVLRRPPLGQVLATAHDMSREYRAISSLADSNVPVPNAIGLCEDIEITGSPFYVMNFVEGVVIRDLKIAETLPVEVRQKMGLSLMEVLARLHDVDVDQVGLGDLGPRENYIERQLKRWRSQFEKSTTREIVNILKVHEILESHVPKQQGVGIVHGDYRIDNTIMDDKGNVAAVLDWELCTLGDVLSDVAGVFAYNDERTAIGSSQSMSLEGFPSNEEMRSHYANISERNLEELDFYLAFNYWRLGCILEGVYSRYAAGVMGKELDSEVIEMFGNRVLIMANLAAETAEKLS